MVGAPMSAFGDFVLSTPLAIASGPEDIVNDAMKNKYLLNRLLSGDMADHLQGGEHIEDMILLSTTSLAQNYQPGVTVNFKNPQVLRAHKADWCFTGTHMAWVDQEVGNNNDGHSNKKWKSVKYKIQQHAWTELMNKMEDDCWATPSYTGMEYGQGGVDPMSIPMLITEGGAIPVPTASWGSTYNIMGLNTATNTAWDNARETFTAVGAVAAGHLFTAFDRIIKRIQFDRLPVKPQYSEQSSQAGFICASMEGTAEIEHALRINQDWFRGMGGNGNDPAYPGPAYMGIPILYFDTLDTAVIHPNHTTWASADGFVTESTYDSTGTAVANATAGPRYYFINPKYLKKIIHSERYFYMLPPTRLTAVGQPTNNVIWVDIWHQNWCASRKRQGKVYPKSDISGGIKTWTP